MQIAQLKVRIGDHEESLTDVTDGHPDIAELMRLATASNAVITIEVPVSPEAAGALGRLVFGKPKVERLEVVGIPETIHNLSRKLDSLELSPRALKALKAAGIRYVWQIVENSPSGLLKIKDFGKKGLTEVTDILHEMNLTPGMSLDRVREHLPVVP